MLFFTQKGKCFWLKVYEIPEGTKASKGRAIQNVLNIDPDDKVKAYINVGKLNDDEYINSNFIILATKRGVVKKTSLEATQDPGLMALMQLQSGKMTNYWKLCLLMVSVKYYWLQEVESVSDLMKRM